MTQLQAQAAQGGSSLRWGTVCARVLELHAFTGETGLGTRTVAAGGKTIFTRIQNIPPK